MRWFVAVALLGASSLAFAQLAPGLVPPPAPMVPSSRALPGGSPVALAPAAHSVSFEVKVGRAGGATELDQSSSYQGVGTTRTSNTNSLGREKQSQLQLEISLRNFSQRPDQVSVEWTFFSERVDENTAYVDRRRDEKDPLRILSSGAQDVALKPGGSERLSVESAKAAMFDTRSSTVSQNKSPGYAASVGAYNHSMKLGQKIAGWLVKVKADGQILGVKASSPRFEKFARDEAALAAVPPAEQGMTDGLMPKDPRRARP